MPSACEGVNATVQNLQKVGAAPGDKCGKAAVFEMLQRIEDCEGFDAEKQAAQGENAKYEVKGQPEGEYVKYEVKGQPVRGMGQGTAWSRAEI